MCKCPCLTGGHLAEPSHAPHKHSQRQLCESLCNSQVNVNKWSNHKAPENQCRLWLVWVGFHTRSLLDKGGLGLALVSLAVLLGLDWQQWGQVGGLVHPGPHAGPAALQVPRHALQPRAQLSPSLSPPLGLRGDAVHVQDTARRRGALPGSLARSSPGWGWRRCWRRRRHWRRPLVLGGFITPGALLLLSPLFAWKVWV